MVTISQSVAIVTGGACGIGRAMVHQLLQLGSKRVILFDSNRVAGEATLKQLDKDRCNFVEGSVVEPSHLQRAFDLAADLEGRVDIVANNAGILDESKPDLMIDVNIRGVLNGSRLALERMSFENGAKGGVVINTASLAGLFTSSFTPAYSATKHAVVGWTGSMGSYGHFKRHGVRFNCLCPAFIETPMLASSLAAGSEQTLLDDRQKLKVKSAPIIPMQLVMQQFVKLIEDSAMNGMAVGIIPPDNVKYLDKSMKSL